MLDKHAVCFLVLALSFNLYSQDLGGITIYNTANSDIAYNKINCLEFDGENRLWIGTEDGLSVFEQSNNNWLNFNTTATPWCSLSSNIINALEWADNLSMMFIGTTDGITNSSEVNESLSDESPGTGAWSPYFGSSCSPNNGVIKSLFYDNGLWSGSTDGLCIEGFAGEGGWLVQNTSTGFYSNNITSIKQNEIDNTIAIGTMNGGLVTYDGEFEIYYSSNSNILDNTVLDVVFDQNNNIIITTVQSGLGVLTSNGSWIWLNTLNSTLPTNSLKKIVVDNNNDLWITTLENGLVHYKNDTFYHYTTENSNLPDNKINCLILGPDNHLWLGTDNSGIIKINTAITSNEEIGKKHTNVFPTVFDSNINIQIIQSGTVSIINQKNQIIDMQKLSNGLNFINTITYKPGLYFAIVKSGNNITADKIIKY